MNYIVPIILISSFSFNIFAQDRAEELLRKADRYRNGWQAFVVHTRIKNFKDGKQNDVGDFQVMIKGYDKTLVRFLNADQKGQYLLMLEDNMWIYLPNTRRPIRVTPLQRLMGNASNGDVARSNFSRDYDARLIGAEVARGEPCHILELTATNQAATYHRVEYWVTKQDARPVKAELYLTSGKHYKSISYDEYKLVDGRNVLTKMTLYDRLRENNFAVMTFSDYQPQDLPQKYFNKNFLAQLK